MAKLKYDRPFNLYLNEGQTTKVPADEVWAATHDFGTDSKGGTNVYGGGFQFRFNSSATITGIAFKHIDD